MAKQEEKLTFSPKQANKLSHPFIDSLQEACHVNLFGIISAKTVSNLHLKTHCCSGNKCCKFSQVAC